MKIVKGVFFVLLFYFIGECVSHLIKGFIPGSIIGMILFFLALRFKAVKVADVRDVCTAFSKNMAIFFIPAGAGLISSFGILSDFWSAILIVCSVSTVLVIIVVALVQQKMEKAKKK